MIGASWDRLRLFTFGELIAHRGRTLTALSVMTVSAALLVAVLSISGSVTGSVDRLTRALGGRAQLEITGITDAGFEQSLLARVTATPGVAAAVPMLRARVGSGDERALLIGADASISALDSALTGSLAEHASALLTVPRGVLVGAATGHALGESFTLGSGTVTVAGVLDDERADALDGGHLIAAPLPLAQLLTDRVGSLDSIQIVPASGADLDDLRRRLTEAVDGRAVVADPDLRTAQAGGAVQIVRFSTLMSAAAALIVSAFLVYNAMSMAVVQRRPMLSLLRAIGGRRGPLVRGLLVEAATIGLLGGAIGAAVGVVMGRVAIDRLPAAIMQSVEARTEYLVPAHAIPVALLACVLAATAAAALAARQIYAVRPIEALAPVGAGVADTTSRTLRWLSVVVGVALAVAAILVAATDLGRLSLAAISMSFAAAVVLCFAATGPLVRATAAVARRFGAPGAVGATTLERAPRRVWATAMTVMIGVASTVAVGGASSDLVDSATAGFQDLRASDLLVSSSSMGQFPTSPLLPTGLREQLAAVPGVAAVDPAQMAFATLGTGRVMLQGFTTGDGAIRFEDVDPAVLPRLSSGDGVVISRDVARSLGVDTGSTVRLPTPTGVREVEVVQVIPYLSVVAGVMVMDLDRLREWYQRPGETMLALDLAPGADPIEVRDRIRALAPDTYVDTSADAVVAISASVRQGTALSSAILWIVVLVATVALLNTLMLSVLERRRELGVLRALGTGPRFLLRAVLAEAAGIGVVGAAIGLVVGIAVQYLATIAIGHAMTIEIVWSPDPVIALYAAAAAALAMLGAIPPALRAARLPVVEALAVD